MHMGVTYTLHTVYKHEYLDLPVRGCGLSHCIVKYFWYKVYRVMYMHRLVAVFLFYLKIIVLAIDKLSML